MNTREMRRLKNAGLTYAAIGQQAQMTRQGVQSRLAYTPHPRRKAEESLRHWLFLQYKRKARARKYGWTLPYMTFTSLLKKDCYYCGARPSNRLQITSGKLVYNGIDRKDNTRGYHGDNAVPCCGVCNKMKGTMSEQKFKAHIHRIVNFLDKKSGLV